MIKKFFIALALLFATVCFAQTQQSVLGINPNTTMKKFNKALLSKGFKPSQIAEGFYEYTITYAGFPNCRMLVRFNNGNDSIRLITIYFPHESYSKDKSIYNNMTSQFKEKYGNEVDWDFLSFKGTHKMKTYGKARVNLCTVSWYYDDEEEDDGVLVEYQTNAKAEDKVSVNPDI